MYRRQLVLLGTLTAAATLARPVFGRPQTKTLVVVELAGGNDGLNTFIPYKDPNYLRLRPTLGIRDGLPLHDRVALHPALQDWQTLWRAGQMAIVQNVGYSNPSLSHFRAQDIWQSAILQGATDTGWLGRYLDKVQAKTQEGVFLGEEYPLALMGETQRYFHLSPNVLANPAGKLGQAIQSIYNTPQGSPLAEEVRRTVVESQKAVQKLQQDILQRQAQQGFTRTGVGQQFALASRVTDNQPRVVYVTVGGWDTHANQPQRHQRLLQELGKNVAAFWQKKYDQPVLMLIYSEFGRRPQQNGANSTDHGTAGAVVLLGAVRGGISGGEPALDSLVQGNLPVKIDFRQVYGEILRQWWGVEAKGIVPGEFARLGVLS
ncbi:protein of unknown function DUF1501 [Gloeomargarita lithophora Alchichica-D10]|uniref:Twin-arginine translocation pathway signal n=1 Tax=Gloeomargarita lithophora Alchichica-D10 TaxID=1188229 RepID=A0A1J0A9F6_9CYAN|nr:DUF1501 domain-containing protein [Gloeomargarita lithophora]APB32551.1 protein of unknown function DUF1501 [Gloeomargarita lithophora Alchichica-D10]